jgi:hypothetical protein
MSAWRFRCPRGHASVRNRQTKPYYYCQPCGENWPGDPFDLKLESLPDESEMPEPVESDSNNQQPDEEFGGWVTWETHREFALKRHNLWEKYGGDGSV